MKQDVKSTEAKYYLREFEDFCWGYSHKSPIYITKAQYERVKDVLPKGNYVVTNE